MSTTPPISTAVTLLRALIAQRSGGESRPQQEDMVRAVEQAMKGRTHLLVQAGTGTGKSLGYLVPAITSGRRVVVSTATKQLGEQIVTDDLPTLAKLIPACGGSEFTYALIKGRNNYACHAKIDELINLDRQAGGGDAELDALFEIERPRSTSPKAPTSQELKDLNALIKWADTTDTGDRTEAPASSDKVWNQVSTDAAGCPGAKNCHFGEQCFAERARAEAREADLVVTNHAQVAQDLRSEFSMFGDWDILIADEVHELEAYLSSAWGVEVNPATMRLDLALAFRKIPRTEKYAPARDDAKIVIDDLDALADLLADAPEGLAPALPEPVMEILVRTAQRLRNLASIMDLAAGAKGQSESASGDLKGAAGKVLDACERVIAAAAPPVDGVTVRWVEQGYGTAAATIKTAPLWVGPELMERLAERTFIATSATITVNGSFEPAVGTFALNHTLTSVDESGGGTEIPPRAYTVLDVGTPFNYDQQAMLYIPEVTFPAPVGQDRFEHTAAVLTEVTRLAKAAGGRTLALFTTRKAAENAAEHLRGELDTAVLCQGDAPPTQLLAEFSADETSTLCATMGFWHGVDVPGPGITLVVMDKVPFAPMNDPLLSSRRNAVDNAGRRGFDEVYVNGAAVMLAQGTGRLIRTATDKGVVAILDTRLVTKGYGRTLLGSLPPMRAFRDRAVVESALTRLAALADANPAAAPARKKVTPIVAAASGEPARRAAPKKSTTRSISQQNRRPA